MRGAPILAATISLALCLAGSLIFESMLVESRELPASADVRSLRCSYEAPRGLAEIYATVRNSGDEPRDYALQVVFETKAGARVGSGYVLIDDAAPGRDVQARAYGDFMPGTVPVRCVLA